MLWAVLLLATAGLYPARLSAEEIILSDLYAAQPLDDSKGTWEDNGGRPHIVGGFDGGFVQIDFKKPADHVQTIVRDPNGWTYHDRSFQNPESIRLDMQSAPAGRYLLEVYTDTEAVGGVFEVK